MISPNPEDEILQSALSAVWRRWGALGASASIDRDVRSVVDPEALLWISLYLAAQEPRLYDLVVSWGLLNGSLISVQRIKNISHDYPEETQVMMAGYARLMSEEGKDIRWRSLIRAVVPPLKYRGNKLRSVEALLNSPPAVLLRVRALLGLGIRADVITFLLTSPEDYVTSRDIAGAIGYNETATRRVLETLVSADGIEILRESKELYSIRHKPLRKILGLSSDDMPRWRFDRELYAFIVDYTEWKRSLSSEVMTDFVIRAKFRNLTSQYRSALINNGIMKIGDSVVSNTDLPKLLAKLIKVLDEL